MPSPLRASFVFVLVARGRAREDAGQVPGAVRGDAREWGRVERLLLHRAHQRLRTQRPREPPFPSSIFSAFPSYHESSFPSQSISNPYVFPLSLPSHLLSCTPSDELITRTSPPPAPPIAPLSVLCLPFPGHAPSSLLVFPSPVPVLFPLPALVAAVALAGSRCHPSASLSLLSVLSRVSVPFRDCWGSSMQCPWASRSRRQPVCHYTRVPSRACVNAAHGVTLSVLHGFAVTASLVVRSRVCLN